MAVSAHRLNLLAAAFFPVATLSAIFSAILGMLLVHPAEQGWSTPTLFWCLLGTGLACGLVLARAIARAPAPVTRPRMNVKAERR